MSEYVFVTMSHDYADEFDVDCCFVEKRKVVEKQMDVIRLAFDANILTESDEHYFGTNEALTFYSFDDFESGVTIKQCSKEFYDEFFELNSGSAVGYCVMDCLYEKAVEGAEALKGDE